MGFIDGSITKPPQDSSSFFARTWCNMIVTLWLINSISKDITTSFMYIDLAKHVWPDLRERFTQSNGPRVFHIQKNFATLVQDNTSVSSYFTKLKMYKDELKSYCPVDACIYGSECKATTSIIASQEREFIL